MLIKASQIYYTVDVHSWGSGYNSHTTYEFISEFNAKSYYVQMRKSYMELDNEMKARVMYRLAKVQNGQSITLACCGYGVMDNYTELKEPIS